MGNLIKHQEFKEDHIKNCDDLWLWLAQSVGEIQLSNNYGAFIPDAWVSALAQFSRKQIIDGFYAWTNSTKPGEPVYVPKLPEIIAHCKKVIEKPMYKQLERVIHPEPTEESKAAAKVVLNEIRSKLCTR